MTLPQDFWEQLPLKTDAELYDMLANQEDYSPEALAAAQDELSKRNLAGERVAQLEGEAQTQQAAAETKAQEPLGWPMRIFIFVFCAGLLGAVLAVYYDSKGYKRKALDCWVTLGVSITFHFLAGIFLYAT
jgi:phosphotransferase system  glucose/maltose/N-acetylglucosamine-specific IIC component